MTQFPSAFRFGSGLLLLTALLTPVRGQGNDDYRQFFKAPETTPEYWRAIQFEMNVGRYDLAARHLNGMLKLEGDDDEKKAEFGKQLLEIEKKDGMSSLLRLRNVEKWSDNRKEERQAREDAESLIDKVGTALKKHLTDPVRIAKFAANLSATPGERAFAIQELRRSGALAVPEIVRILQETVGQPGHAAVVSALSRLRPETVPALLAALDIDDETIKGEIIGALMERDDFTGLARRQDTDPRPYLYFVYGSPKTPDWVRKKAAIALGLLEGVNPERIDQPRIALVAAAERYAGHQMKFGDPKAVEIWRWDGKGLVMDTTTATRAEEYYGLRFARQALDLDPAFERAQIAFLSLAVEKGVEAGGIDKPLGQSAPKLKELLATVNPDLVVAALERALDQRRLAVVLGLVRALGDQGDVKATRPRSKDRPVLIRALDYPDRRVQFAAADSLLRIGAAPQGSGRVVDVLRRSVNLDPAPKVLIADFNKERGDEVGNAIKGLGYETVIVQTGKQILKRLEQANDIDIILIDWDIADLELPDLLAQLRADINASAIPLVVTVPPTPKGVRQPEKVLRTERLARGYRNVSVVPATLDPDVLKPLLPEKIAAAQGAPITPGERQAMTGESITWLKRLATGEVAGYNVAPAEDAILRAFRNEDLAALALQAASRLPSRTAQRDLANMAIDDKVPANLRALAATELNRSIQTYGLVLLKAQIKALEELFQKTEDPGLKGTVAQVLGSMRPDAVRTGERLKGFSPAPAEAGPKPKEKEKEEEKKDKKDDEKKDK